RLATLPVLPVRASLLPKPPPRAAAPVAAPAPVAPAAVRAPVPAAAPAPAVRPAPAPSTAHRAAVPAAASAPIRGVAQQAVRTAAASTPVQAQPVSRPTARQPASPVEALCGPLMSEIRAAIRGRSLGELASGIAASPELAEEALTLLVARGAIIRRGHKYFAA
ncbi:MAG TPA: wire protein, partial [Archangium sp.]|nr:wire protein [Archangium sp.]